MSGLWKLSTEEKREDDFMDWGKYVYFQCVVSQGAFGAVMPSFTG
jgi:hypothetical protein